MKTRFTSIIGRAAIALLLVILAPPTEAWADFSWDGDGTSSAPYQIDTYEKLKEFAAIVNGTSSVSSSNSLACAKLTADILCNDQDWTPIGENIQPYAGTFDGDGYTITGLSNSSNSSDYAALFGYVGSQGVVRNVTLVNATITGKNVGAIVSENAGTVQNCRLIGASNISGKNRVGGIVASNTGTIQNCYVAISGSISVSNSQFVLSTVNYPVGGIAAINSGKVENCHYSGSGSISGSGSYMGTKAFFLVGGIVGQNDSGTVSCCYYAGTGTISGNTVGAIIGDNSATAEYCYYNKNNTTLTKAIGNADDSENVKGLTTYQFQDMEHFSDFDSDVWLEGVVAPLLKGMQYTISFNANGGEGSMANQTVTSTNSDALRTNTFTRDNYHFTGWNTKSDGTGVAVAANVQAKLVGPETLYAQWCAKTSLVAYEAVAPTCTEEGNSAYWQCTVCFKYFSDENGENEIAEDSWVIPASHSLTAHEAVAATCTTAGSSAYWECSVCHKYFSDANGEQEIDENSWITNALGHEIVNGACTRCPIITAAYIDATGAEQSELAMPLDGTETTLGRSGVDPDNNNKPYETWYVCNTAATANNGNGLAYTSGLTLNGNVHLILADGCQINIGTSESRIDGNGIIYTINNAGQSLTIYSQSGGTGALNVYVTGNHSAIGAQNVTINGGIVIANGFIGIHALDDVTINGGHVTATGNEHGIYASSGTITLGWKNATDFIKANSYLCDNFQTSGKVVKTVDGKALKYTDSGDNTLKLIGTVSNVGAIAGQTLTPYGIWGYCGKDDAETDVDESKNLTWDIPLAINATSATDLATTMNIEGTGEMADYSTAYAPWKNYNDGISLILVADETAYTTYAPCLNTGDKAKLAPQTITLAKNASGWGTFCHGYPVTYSLSEATAYTISGLSDNNTNVTPTAVDNNVVAPRTPLLLGYTAPDNSNETDDETVTLTAQPETAPAAVSSTAIVSSDFEGGSFYGNCSNTFVSPDDLDDYYDEGQTYLLYNGKFIQADENGGLDAHKCLLVLSGTNNAPVLTIGETTSLENVQCSMFNVQCDNSWFTLDGRKLDKQPTAKGIYIHNSKKVVIK